MPRLHVLVPEESLDVDETTPLPTLEGKTEPDPTGLVVGWVKVPDRIASLWNRGHRVGLCDKSGRKDGGTLRDPETREWLVLRPLSVLVPPVLPSPVVSLLVALTVHTEAPPTVTFCPG